MRVDIVLYEVNYNILYELEITIKLIFIFVNQWFKISYFYKGGA